MTQYTYVRHKKKNEDGVYVDLIPELAKNAQGFTDDGAISTALNTKVNKTTTINNHALTGNISLTKADIGLNNVENTSDANKPISTATQNALNNKVDKLSTSPAGNGFVKVNVNAQGQVTGHSAMVEGDIPTLSISKTSGLQSAIDSKLTIPQVVGPGAENNEECYVVTTSTSGSLPLPSGVSTGSDHAPIKIVNGTAVAVAHTLMDLDTEQTITAKKHIPTATMGDLHDVAVNKGFVEASGAGKPNNLVHDVGTETINGLKVFNNNIQQKLTDDALTRPTQNVYRGILQNDINGVRALELYRGHYTNGQSDFYITLRGENNAVARLHFMLNANGSGALYIQQPDSAKPNIVLASWTEYTPE